MCNERRVKNTVIRRRAKGSGVENNQWGLWMLELYIVDGISLNVIYYGMLNFRLKHQKIFCFIRILHPLRI